ncbi:amidase signature enzyme [Dichomitus squalens]|uniref:Amidase signature enzyme n=1 Tax=Dichomitus squalens TaxID=114155 RepID=A0A4Q9MRC5_9APHY|nr:amidase signature enzyme [Dichomitus squalens]
MHMPNVDKKAPAMPSVRRRPDGGRARPAANPPSSSDFFVMRLTVASLFTLFIAFAWVGFGFTKEAARAPATSAALEFPDLYEASITELQDGLQKGLFTSVDLVKAYFARIEEVNLQGPTLRAVIETNPSALEQAAALDLERRTTGARGPLHGIPIILKDNIATLASEGMNTTAGSFALLGSIVPRDAHVAAKLRAAGAILLGKANLSEWANFRGNVPSGFSGRGGQASSPYVPLGDPCGSSSGSGISSAIGLAAGALGSETDGSIVCPSGMNNLVGIKPTVGLTSRDGVVPISEHQDTVGPMTRSVTDAAIILSAIAGRDPRDNFTLAQPPVVPDYTQALRADGLKGQRLGVPRKFLDGLDPVVVGAFNASLETMKGLGATIIDPADFPDFDEFVASNNETVVLNVDFKVDVNRYISELVEVPTGVKNLADLIAFNIAHADEELVPPFWTDQSQFITSENTTVDQAFFDAVAADKDLGATRGIDATLKAFNLDALLLPTDVSSTPAAIAGYPIITVPLGFLPPNTTLSPAEPTRSGGPNQPFGLSFLGTAFSEFQLVSLAFAYEQATHTRLQVLAFPAAIPKTQLADVVSK